MESGGSATIPPGSQAGGSRVLRIWLLDDEDFTRQAALNELDVDVHTFVLESRRIVDKGLLDRLLDNLTSAPPQLL